MVACAQNETSFTTNWSLNMWQIHTYLNNIYCFDMEVLWFYCIPFDRLSIWKTKKSFHLSASIFEMNVIYYNMLYTTTPTTSKRTHGVSITSQKENKSQRHLCLLKSRRCHLWWNAIVKFTLNLDFEFDKIGRLNNAANFLNWIKRR